MMVDGCEGREGCLLMHLSAEAPPREQKAVWLHPTLFLCTAQRWERGSRTPLFIDVDAHSPFLGCRLSQAAVATPESRIESARRDQHLLLFPADTVMLTLRLQH